MGRGCKCSECFTCGQEIPFRMLYSVQYLQIFSEYVESHAKVMSENTYENEITYLTHCVVYEETCFNVWDFSV